MINSRLARFLIVLALVAACSGPSATPTAPPTPTAAPPTPTAAPATPTAAPATATPGTAACSGQKVTFLLSFFPNIQHIGFLIAANRGYYADEGLDVEVQPGGPDVNVESAVGDGSVNMGLVGSFGAVLKAREGGVPLVAIAQPYQRMQMFFWSAGDSGIETIADWAGKKVGQIAAGATPERDAMLLANNMTSDDLVIVQQSFGIDDFQAGNVDIGEGVIYFHPAALALAGGTWPDDYNVFYPDDNGASLADQVVATNEDYLAANPDVFPCFLRASIRGWTDALNAWQADDVASVIPDLYAFASPEAFPQAHQELAFNDVMAIVAPEGSGPEDLLQMDTAKLDASYQTLRDVGYLETEFDVGDSYDTSFMDSLSQ